MSSSKIEWTESTWNPTTGCTKISSGCVNCYAEKMAMRLKAMGTPKYANGFKVTLHEDCLSEPYSWKKPKVIFVNSMSDLFHEDIPFEFIEKVFKVMNENPQHIFQVLTKRAELLLEYSPKLNWTSNIWMGVTVENFEAKRRIDYLRQTTAAIKFLSCEPLISDLGKLYLENINWVIVGGESGPKSRPIKEDWVLDIFNQCKTIDIPFFFKQWGGVNKKKTGKELQGVIYQEMPEIIENWI
ncbi:MAG: phage Gp37/Gp68 family protein [Prolixibacteraceae bacterium]|nr:phage Gp37/Gp68 family protein [Prolixibacteraceae bacterium]